MFSLQGYDRSMVSLISAMEADEEGHEMPATKAMLKDKVIGPSGLQEGSEKWKEVSARVAKEMKKVW